MYNYCRKKVSAPTIDISTYEPKHEKSESKPWISELSLLESDKDIVLNTTAWINDSVVNAAQKLLKKQFTSLNGLQDVALGYVMSFQIQTGDFLQILHTIITIG